MGIHKEEFQETYRLIASLINADPGEIALMENATAAWNAAFLSIPFESGDIILTTENDYASNYIAYLRLKERIGVQIKIVPATESGEVSLDHLAEMLNPRVKLVSVCHFPTNGGLVNPAEEIGALLRDHEAFYLLDACQSAGQYPLDVERIGCDFLSTTGRKYLRAPRGTGFLFASRKAMSKSKPITLDLHSAEWLSEESYAMDSSAKRYENWEFNYASIFGLKTAIDYAANIGLDTIWDRVREIASFLRDALKNVPYITVHDRGLIQSGIVTFTSDRYDPGDLKERLAKKNIHVSVGSKSGALLDMNKRRLDTLVRSSVHYYNSEEEIDAFIRVLNEWHF